MSRGVKLIDITNKRYGRLLVVSMSHRDNRRAYYWNCICDCGTTKVIRGGDFKFGGTQSCGCLLKETISTHKESCKNHETKEYKCWKNIKSRCLYVNQVAYKNYGGRGIKVCDRWINSYENFIADMGRAPSNKHTIERIDNNGNYEPSNCRRATMLEQSKNKRGTILIRRGDEIKSLAQWCKSLDLCYSTIYGRIWKYKMTPEQAISWA